MEAWRAVKQGLLAKVYFQAAPGSAMEGEWIWLRVLRAPTVGSPDSEFLGEVLDHPMIVDLKPGAQVSIALYRVEEVKAP